VAALDYLSLSGGGDFDRPVLLPEKRFDRVVDVALTDGLTGLYDSSTLRLRLDEEISRFNRYGNQVSLLMFDIDFFKKYNDTYGHLEGDRILVAVAKVLKSETRDIDLCARYGGEEFAVLLPHTNLKDAAMLAERIRAKVEEKFADDGGVTVSAGVATCPTHSTDSKELFLKADKALYIAKDCGRNNVKVPTL
jgi:diguanylate cyclase (GGDEF)-like protein